MHTARNASRAAALLSLLALGVSPASAGPPFLTDDPEPVGYGHWEVYTFATSTLAHGDAAGTLPGVEANYGAAPNLQVHVAASLAFNSQNVTGTQFGYGDTEFGVKYRFVTPAEDDWWPQVGVFPLVAAATGDSSKGLGTGRTHGFFPVWLQKDFGEWTTYGGGGYWVNPGPGNKNYWFFGWQLQRKITDDLTLGGELFHETAFATGGPGSVGFPLGSKDQTGFNLGGIYDLTESDHLLLSAGRGLQNAEATNRFSYYLGYQRTF